MIMFFLPSWQFDRLPLRSRQRSEAYIPSRAFESNHRPNVADRREFQKNLHLPVRINKSAISPDLGWIRERGWLGAKAGGLCPCWTARTG
jgi:hypothetical protein